MNHGPDDQSPDGLDSDELALRRLLHGAVQEIEPRDGTLDHLRRAVPARRARKRQAVVGMAAAALFIGTAVPALVHVSNATGPDANPSIAGHGSAAQGGTSEGRSTEGTGQDSGGSSDRTEEKDGGEKGDDKGKGGSTENGSGDSADPSAPSSESTAPCTADQLSAGGGADAPDSTGAVYGTFRITNISGGGCTVSGPGAMTPLAQGAADPARIALVGHVAGDPAAGLPDPSLEVPQLVLLPGAAYEVKFAWVPSDACPTGNGDNGSGGNGGNGGSGEPTPDPTPTETSGTTPEGTSTGGDTGVTTQLLTEDGTLDGSVALTYAAEGGAPATGVTISNACAGTVYRTGVLSAS
ncbi:hypothetical protein ACWC10_20085 [Streptomyces sp. NPDC001595]|uniref:hypothetical protein n=1 Tax=Streptomyces sp. NPDC001532 TaxID=3154520 RepID=UPI003322464C